jgi:hypothetical protein
MLLLKGKAGKSEVLDILSKETNSLTVIYYNQPVLSGLYVNSDTMKFQDFMFELQKYIKPLSNQPKYDYLIVYTNQGEPTIKNQKELFQQWESIYGFKILVGCQ